MAELDPRFPPLPVNRWPLALVAMLFFGGLVYLLQPILLPFVLGALIAYLGDPLADFLERRSMSRTVAVVLVFLFFTCLTVIGMLIAIPLATSPAL